MSLGQLVAARLLALLLQVFLLVVVWPLAVVLGLLVLLIDLLATPWVAWSRTAKAPAPAPAPAGLPQRTASIIVVSFDGKDFLARLLPSLWAAVDAHGGDHEVIVVDNGSRDDSAGYVRAHFPRTKIVSLPENRFFVRGNMAGVAAATRDTLVFVNNDMVVARDFLGPLLGGFSAPDTFAVAAEVFFADPTKRREETGKTTGRLDGGFVQLAHRLPTAADTTLGYTPTFWAGGGAAAFDHRRFLAIGGFDPTFDPFYLEDAGVSYQAWKRGWHVLFTPASSVVHEHRGTSRRVFGDAFVDAIIRRNQHLFLWRNVTSPQLTAKYFALLPFGMVARAKAAGGVRARALRFELHAFLRALPRLPAVLWRRQASRPHYCRRDEEVVELANHNRRLAWSQRTVPAGPRLRLLFLCARLPRLDTDGSWIVFNLLRELSRRHEVSVFSLIERPEEEAQAGALRVFCTRVTTHLRTRDFGVLDPHRLLPADLRLDYSSPALRAAVRAELETGDYDLVQVEYGEMAHAAAPHIGGVPAVYVCHEARTVVLARLRAQAQGWRARLAAWHAYVQGTQAEIRFTRTYGHVVTLTDVDAHSLQRLLPDLRVRTIASGVDLERFVVPPEQEPEPGSILFVANFTHAPNLDAARWLIGDVMPAVRAQEPAAVLHIIGRGLPAELASAGAQAGVVAMGFVPDLLPQLRRAAVVAVPVRLGGGMRGKVLEAFAARRAVVATRIGAAGLAAADGEHLLLADDAPAFAAAVVRVLRDPALRRRLGQAAHDLAAERYSAAAAAAQYERLYGEVLGVPLSCAAAPEAVGRGEKDMVRAKS